MKKAIVTGGEGFIGTHLMRALRERGFEALSVDIKSGNDILDTEKLKEIFKGASYVFHTAALPRVPYSIEHPQETNHTNVEGTLSVLVAAHEAGVERVVYSGSSSAYGNQETMPLIETMQANPMSPYALQKHIGEQYCKLFSEVYNLSTVSLRYFNVYGPGMDPNGAYALAIGKFIKQRQDGVAITITGDGTQTRDFTHVRDVVSANLLAAQSPKVGKGEVMNIGAGRGVSMNDVAALIGGPVEHIAPRLEPHDTRADNACARELIGWQPTIAIEEGIAELKQIANLN
jgi:UDP-glucose 4-epimerase